MTRPRDPRDVLPAGIRGMVALPSRLTPWQAIAMVEKVFLEKWLRDERLGLVVDVTKDDDKLGMTIRIRASA